MRAVDVYMAGGVRDGEDYKENLGMYISEVVAVIAMLYKVSRKQEVLAISLSLYPKTV